VRPNPNKPVEATETRGAVRSMETGDRTDESGLRASPDRYVWKLKATRLALEENEPRLS
jgi:hypothetical protein